MGAALIVGSPIPTKHPLVAPLKTLPFVDPGTGMLTATSAQFLQQVFAFLVGTSRIIPCTCTFAVGSFYTLTQLGIGPTVKSLTDYDTFGFVAPAASTGAVTQVSIINSSRDLLAGVSPAAPLQVFTPAGVAVAAGGIALGGQYFVTYDSSQPCFILR